VSTEARKKKNGFIGLTKLGAKRDRLPLREYSLCLELLVRRKHRSGNVNDLIQYKLPFLPLAMVRVKGDEE
jgi:hypothetical protein